ncbi:two component transcriptional regulator, LytTR family [Alkalithermobacter thermoalcaliphilus JW-YL-7 = DSM 7308]|uniref:Stage 0 sporulation protein A homolog n=1 Tax=Alkalithermobacter thermoalcaliphilus JW-YL-7 = DSM 7308 TaxID=1121328 RepID=A0A150FP85_CLOPD|nr:two component transcriptional regulator, LytTR family [[Clostridium] paradoxum JW-YL-7 = DSM 7308]SHK51102.1 two component transcriptional regulator, LytTR family [[Clostridium] paradoxum JW-YL-7 = DSM 7308]
MDCIIIDDEYPARQELKHFIQNYSCIKIVREFQDSISALSYLEKNKPQIIFLDISMPGLDGMSFAKIINNFREKPKIVFITAHKEYAAEAFEIEAFDYILKPYSQDRIINVLNKLQLKESMGYNSEKITLWKGEKMVVLNSSDICYCEADERETIIYTKEDIYKATYSISEFAKKLPKNKFFRTHRSFIVNIDKINEIIPWFNNTYIVKLKELDVEIPVSRKNIKEFRHIMGI